MRFNAYTLIERQKATRQLKKLRKRLLGAESTEVAKDLTAQMHVAEVDLNYTQYYPLNERYISLYPQKDSAIVNGGQDEDVDTAAKKPPMWAEVEKRMTDGTLNQLRNEVRAKVTKVASEGNVQSSLSILPKSQPASIQSFLEPQVNGTAIAKRTTGFAKSKKPLSTSRKHRSSDLDVRHVDSGASRDKEGGDESDGGFFEE